MNKPDLSDPERARILREAHECESQDAYFAPRPVEDGAMQRKVFREGFYRGWDALAALSEQRAEPAPQPSPGSGELPSKACGNCGGLGYRREANGEPIPCDLCDDAMGMICQHVEDAIHEHILGGDLWLCSHIAAKRIAAALAAKPVSDAQDGREAEPVGACRWSPVVTDEMIAAAEDIEDLHKRGTPQTWAAVYRAMLAAAPQAAPGQPVARVDGVGLDGRCASVFTLHGRSMALGDVLYDAPAGRSAEDSVDARRYRWIRDTGAVFTVRASGDDGRQCTLIGIDRRAEGLDEAIDAAMNPQAAPGSVPEENQP